MPNLTGQQAYTKGQPRNRKIKGKEARESQLAMVGADSDFQAFLRLQASCLDGDTPCVVCHVRRTANAGTGFKPLYSAVPMTFDQHNEQSWHGESACLNRFIPKKGMWTNLEAKAWFDKQVEKYLELWKASKVDIKV